MGQMGSAAPEPPSARQQPSTSTPPSLPSSCSPGLPSDLPWCPVASWAPENWPQHQLLLREISSTSLPDRPIERGPVKALIFPAEWFDALYPKTGVTGTYLALFGVSTFLASKEYFVMEHDFYVGIGLAIVLTYLIKTQGPALPISQESRVCRIKPQPGRTSSLPRRKPSASSWGENTAAGFQLLMLLSRRGLTTRWRQPMCCAAWSRSTWLTGSLAT